MSAAESPERPDDRGRTCVSCGEKVVAWDDALVRLVVSPVGDVAVDVRTRKGGAAGRGLWIHPRPACIGKLPQRVAKLRKAGATAFRGDPEAIAALRQDVADALGRKARSLLSAARRAGHVAVGTHASQRVADKLELCVVARDARAGADLGFVAEAVRAGRAVAFLSKEELFDVLGPLKGVHDATSVAVAVVTDPALGREIGEAIRAADALGAAVTHRSEGGSSGESAAPGESAFRTAGAALSGGPLSRGEGSISAAGNPANEDAEPDVRTRRSGASADVE